LLAATLVLDYKVWPYFLCANQNDFMEDNTKKDSAKDQAVKDEKTPINPFKDAAGGQTPQPSVAEEAALEQQRKEALTERD
jgi:hypothetical protein